MSRPSVRGAVLFAAAVAFLAPSPAAAQKGDGGVVVGKVWEFELKQNKEVVDSGRMRVRGYELFGPGGKKLGTYKTLGADHMKITFTDGRFRGYEADMRLSKREPPTWVGFATRDGADRLHFKYTFLKD